MTQARLEALLGVLLAGNHRKGTEELVRQLTGLYGAGLTRVVTLLREHDPAALDSLAEDDVVADLLVLHDLHPLDTGVRVRRAVDGAGGEYLGADAGVVRVRLGPGCSTASKTAIEAAVRSAAPELDAVEVVAEARLHQIGMGPPRGAAPEGRAS